ncbi:uncharacterized protein LOC112055529 [Bicyclus anynana]|uniref:Uncharacterized protein LOC112055529 n=1 Tax=Bicyclus anynana TaxID=110368 RepID=A0A6J1P100_BICAN|nr:uncharacterized protein LOC112055529 [Bicyclus anynana]XP_023951456.2 uncharacterized protein LOC112055529 [Bicyclus anynana]XP_023951457.2 uncharacterized protein LOC112055529 [Bicyclus anynana]XP_023951459.2 uncharacterized protein LOC112055529 [Bicyclus anynana]XP_052742001.1 uncharacterized protein LOC112055529 [Bicyclus anynana]
MVYFFIYAKDYSNSTCNDEYYHINGLKTLEQFITDVEKSKNELVNAKEPPVKSRIVYLHWGHICEEVEEETTRTAYLQRQGDGKDTLPEKVIDWLKLNYNICSENSTIKLFYIITGGRIHENSVKECIKSNRNMHYEKVVFHAFNQDLNEIDISVASSFFKSQCMVYCNNELYDYTDFSEEFDYDKFNLVNFAFYELKSYIELKFLKKIRKDVRVLKEIKKIKKLRTRLHDELAFKTEVDLATKNRNEFIREFVRTDWYQDLTSVDGMRYGKDYVCLSTKFFIDQDITTMINYLVSLNKSNTFDALKINTKFNKFVEKKPIADIHFTAQQEIAFPDINWDEEKGIPVVILTYLDLLEKFVFHGQRGREQRAGFRKFRTTMECPLFLVNDKDISESIGSFYSLNVYKEFLANNIKTEPRTRRPFCGGLVLRDTVQYDYYNDYILSATYFNSKKVNFNVGLFYYVLWKNCENKEWMDRNVVEQFKKYAMRRVSETVCKIGLTTLQQDPQENTSLLTALWYCVDLSSCIFKDDPKNFTHERMRMFYDVSHCMIEILKYFEYDLDIESIEKRRELLSHVMTLKRIDKSSDKVYYLLKEIFKTEDDFLVSEIEKPFNLYKLNYLKLNHKNILNDNVINEKVHLNDYVHLMYVKASKVDEDTFEISEKTFRPIFAVDQNKSFYTELVNNTKKVVINNDDDQDKIKLSFEPIDSLDFHKVLSLYKLFINCVIDQEKYPTLAEYVDYVCRKKKFYGNSVTIFPPKVFLDIKDVYDRYQNIVTNVEVNKFIDVCNSYFGRIERIKAEEKVMFNSDDKIKEFISSQENRVKKKT